MLSLVVRLKYSNQGHLFQTSIFDSQSCERTFRQLRSMTTMNFTKINFSINDLLHLIGRVELQYDIIYNKLASSGIIFPRIKIDNTLDNKFDMPSNEEIISIVKEAQDTALNDIRKFGIKINPSDIEHCDVKMRPVPKLVPSEESASKDDDLDQDLDDDELTNEIEEEAANENIDHLAENLSHENLESNNTSHNKYILICEEDGQEKFVRKSKIVWLLSDSTKKLSNDRLKRVQMVSADVTNSAVKRSKTTTHQDSLHETLNKTTRDELKVGQWVICWRESKEEDPDDILVEGIETVLANILIGVILGFRFSSGKTDKEKQYRSDVALITNDPLMKNVDILATWYKIGENGELSFFDRNSYFMGSQQYIDKIEDTFIVTGCQADCIERKLSVNVYHVKEKISALKGFNPQ